MDYGQLISRSVQITLRHRALWLYGFLLALFGGAGGGGNFNLNSRFPTTPGTPGPGGTPPVPNIPGLPPGTIPNLQNIPPSVWATIGVAFACLLLFFIVVGTIVQNVSRTALIGMVNEVEEGHDTSIGQGWSFGWSRLAWRNFLLNLLVGILVFLVALAIALILVALAAGLGISLNSIGNNANQTGGAVVGLVCLALLCIVPLFLILVVGVTTTVALGQRHIVVRDAGVMESLRAGWELFRANIATVIIFLIIVFVLSLVWGLVTGAIALILGLGLAGLPGFLVYALTQQTTAGILAAVPGLLAVGVLFAIIGTLWTVFHETIWTLFYRALVGRPGATTGIVPAAPLG